MCKRYRHMASLEHNVRHNRAMAIMAREAKKI